MSALYRLKAYFGMVPAEELDDYAFGEDDRDGAIGDYDYEPAYERGRRTAAVNGSGHGHGNGNGHGNGHSSGHGNGADRSAERRSGRSRWGDEDDYSGGHAGYGSDGYNTDGYDTDGYDTGYYDEDQESTTGRRSTRGWAADAPVRGALAVDPNREVVPARDAREVAVRARPAPAEEVHPLARITTLHPRTYNEARTIGEHYREGIPVIMNLTGMEDADAKRLVDFAAGLAFALRGSIDKITTKVFLISPPNVDVTAEDRRRLAEGSFLNRSV